MKQIILKMIMRTTIKQHVEEATMLKIASRPKLIFPSYELGFAYHLTYKGKIEQETLLANGYEFAKVRDFENDVIIDGKKLHGNKSIYYSTVYFESNNKSK
jgi:hypothetical protein